MPTVNIYYRNEDDYALLLQVTQELKAYLADKLSCNDIKLKKDEVSIRFIAAGGEGMLGGVELEINANEFSERVERQDIICHDTKQFVEHRIPSVGEVRVWLKLCKLGHDVLH